MGYIPLLIAKCGSFLKEEGKLWATWEQGGSLNK
jgi:hypothetical protein